MTDTIKSISDRYVAEIAASHGRYERLVALDGSIDPADLALELQASREAISIATVEEICSRCHGSGEDGQGQASPRDCGRCRGSGGQSKEDTIQDQLIVIKSLERQIRNLDHGYAVLKRELLETEDKLASLLSLNQ